jgi:hypothetical protein
MRRLLGIEALAHYIVGKQLERSELPDESDRVMAAGTFKET